MGELVILMFVEEIFIFGFGCICGLMIFGVNLVSVIFDSCKVVEVLKVFELLVVIELFENEII